MGLFVVAGLVIALTQPAAAFSFTDTVSRVLSVALSFVASMLGKLTVVLFGLVVQVAQYNGFGDASAVSVGWVVVRDVANMFFIMILLVIAFGAVFRLEQYRYTTMLRRLIVMAVLINFSKLITSFFIDLMQVIMMTFVNAFANTAAGNLANALGLQAILQLDPTIAGSEVTPVAVTVTLLLGVIMLTVAMVVTLVYVLMLLVRIIALWVLTVLSPLAYLFNAFPSTKTYSAQWWDYFWKYATMGPFLAFFLWLTLTVTRAGNVAGLITDNLPDETGSIGAEGGGRLAVALSSVSSAEGILSFIVAIVLLVMGLQFSSRVGGVAGNMASNTVRRVQRAGAGAARLALLRGPMGVVGGAYNRTIQSPVEAAAQGITGALGGSRIPILSSWGTNQNAKITAFRKERTDRASKFVNNINDLRILRRLATSRGFSPEAQERRRAARLRAPSQLPVPERAQAISGMNDQEFSQLSAAELYRLSTHPTNPFNFLRDAPDKAEQIVRRLPMVKRAAAGLQDYMWDNSAQTVVPRIAAPAGPLEPPRYNPNLYRSSADMARLSVTEQAIRDRHEGSAEKFYASAEYKVNPKLYLPQEEMELVLDQQRRRDRAQQRGGFDANAMSGAEKATRQFSAKGAGQVMTLAINHADEALRDLNLNADAEGVNVSDPREKERFSVLLAEKYRQDAAQKREEEELQRLRAEAEQGGQSLTQETEQQLRTQAAQSVQNDAAFQRQTQESAERFAEAIRSASSLAIINKGRATGGERDILRHEKSHDVVGQLTPQQKQQLLTQFTPESLEEKRAYVRGHWVNGQQMRPDDVDTEVLTEIIGKHGRGNIKGPLAITPQDEQTNGRIQQEFGNTLKRFRDERARFEVAQLSDQQIDTLWSELTPDRQRQITEQLKPSIEDKNIDEKGFLGDVGQRIRMRGKNVPREFFAEAYANFFDKERGAPTAGRRTAFQGDEQDLALLIRSLAQKQPPSFRRGEQQMGGSQTVPIRPILQPSGVRSVTAQPPEAPRPAGTAASVSPAVQQTIVNNVTQNTTVRSIASDLSRQIAGDIQRLPVSTNLQYALNRLRDEIRGVAEKQGISREHTAGLEAGIDSLQKRVADSSRRGVPDPKLGVDLKKFLDQFEPEEGGEFAAATPPPAPRPPRPNPPGVEESI